MPPISHFLTGNDKYGYAPVEVINPPGTIFQYSGAGFIVLEHLIEAHSGKSIKDLTSEFLQKMNLTHFTFEQKNKDGFHYVDGIKENGKKLDCTRKMFPAFAAGAMSNALDVTSFLQHLTKAYFDLSGSTSISHDVARLMLFGKDLGVMKFMGALMGQGIFIAEAGDNKLVIHQGANDGFRALFVHCVHGPDRGLGFTILSNGELNAVSAISECAQEIFRAFNFSGIDYSKFQNQFKSDSLKQEEIVNIGYKSLVFSAFEPMLPEKIIDVGPRDPHCELNLALHAEVIEATNQKFARAENLFSEYLPVFDPNLFGKQGKIMDSWETVRHNKQGVDTLVFKLKKPSNIKYVSISTKFHFGNQAEYTRLEGWNETKKEWVEILSKTKLDGHALKNIKADGDSVNVYSLLRFSNFPDGGISRLSLYNDSFSNFEVKNEIFTDEIPKTLKPLAAPYSADKNEIEKNWSRLKKGEEVDVASLAFGGKLIRASNEHYGPAIQTISPFAPMNMFDGLESARSRKAGHFEEAHIALAKASLVHKVQLDFKYFVNNNPYEVSLVGLSKGEWKSLAEKVLVKPFAGSKKEILIDTPIEIEEVKLLVYPDGGVNRLRVYSFV
jgi:allantoicase